VSCLVLILLLVSCVPLPLADLRVSNTVTWEQAVLAGQHRAAVKSVSFSRAGRILASASIDGTVRLWDVAAGTVLAILDVPWATSVVFSSDGRLLATDGWADPVRLCAVPVGDQTSPATP
jgi:WD40 repeat protein